MFNPEVGVAMARWVVLRTTDRGNTWSKVLDLPRTPRPAGGIDFSMNKHGLGLLITPTLMYVSSDTGRTWSEVPTVQRPQVSNDLFFRVDVRDDEHQRLVTVNGRVYERPSMSSGWVADTTLLASPPIDIEFVNDTLICALLSDNRGLMWRHSRDVYSIDTSAPSVVGISFDDTIGVAFRNARLFVSRDRFQSWVESSLNIVACSLAVVKDGCILVVTDEGLYHSGDIGTTWAGPIRTGVYGVNAVHQYECDAFIGFGDYNEVALLRSLNGVSSPVVAVEESTPAGPISPKSLVVRSIEDFTVEIASLPSTARIMAYDYLGQAVVVAPGIGESLLSVIQRLQSTANRLTFVVIDIGGALRQFVIVM